MDKEDVGNIHTHICIHIHIYIHIYMCVCVCVCVYMAYYSANCTNMDGHGGHYAKWNKSYRKNTVWYHLYVESKKYNKLLNKAKIKKQSCRYQWQDWAGGRGGWVEHSDGIMRSINYHI